MSDKTSLEAKREGSDPLEPFFVDGCKVTVHYSASKNPDAIRGIRNILLSGTKSRKN